MQDWKRDWRKAAMVIAALMAVVLLLIWMPLTPDASTSGRTTPSPQPELTFTDAQALSQEQVAAQQHAARQAALHAVNVTDVSAPVTERPDYVSPVEWLVLRQVAAHDEDPQHTLARLVNKLRFSKQVELWQQQQGSNRSALGEQLLDAIPAQVQREDLAQADAHLLQRDVLDAIEPDPARRQRRLGEEADRIGVVFEVGDG